MSKSVHQGEKHVEHQNVSIATYRNTTEDHHLLTIFPKEIWGLVFEHVNFAQAYENISNSSKILRKILKPRRVQLLLCPVVNILLFREFGEEFSQTLKLRSVCHSWKKTLDTVYFGRVGLLEHREGRFYLFNFPYVDDEYDEEHEYETEFQVGNVFQDFENHFDSTHLVSGTNPFITRQVTFVIPDKCQQLYFAAVLQLLRKYGHHIWKCKLKFGFVPNRLYPDGAYEALGTMFDLLPNLKHFKIVSHSSVLDNDEQMKIIEQNYKSLILPNVEKLENLSLKCVPECVAKTLIESNSQIKSLRVFGNYGKEGWQSSLESLSNLKEISLDIGSKKEFGMLENCAVISHPTNVELDIAEYSAATVFRMVEKQFGNAVTELRLCLENCEYLECFGGFKMPLLKMLWLKMDYPATIDFILPLKDSLKYLKLELANLTFPEDYFRQARKREGEDEDVIKIYKYWNQLHKSNVWEQLPKLELIAKECNEYASYSEINTCARREWKNYVRKTRSPSPSESDSSDYEYY